MSNSIASCEATQLLDGEDGLLNLLPQILLVFAAILYVGMAAEVQFLFDTTKAGGLLVEPHLFPQPIDQGFPIWWYVASNSSEQFLVVDLVCCLLIKNIKQAAGFSVGDVNPLFPNNLCEFVVTDQSIAV